VNQWCANTMKPTSFRIHREFNLPVRLCRFSRRRWWYWAALAVAMIAGRVALLPILPPPDPEFHDEFSYLLAADTFAHGRLTNPSPPLPQFFESPHILVSPFYASKYQPGQGLLLAFGQKFLGHPYWGVVLSGAAMVFLFCWAADAWLPPQWTLIAGGISAILFFVRHYWFSSYWGGALAACGGALVVGGFGRLLQGKIAGARFSLSAGALILFATRPYEGGALCLATVGILAFQFVSRRPEERRIWLRAVILPNAAVLLVAALLIGWYNRRVTGHATDLPYFEYSRQYDLVPVLWVLDAYPPKEYSSSNTRARHLAERNDYQQLHRLSLPGAIGLQLFRFFREGVWLQFRMFGLLLAGVPLARMHKRKKWLVLLLAAGVMALLLEVWIHGHYTAPYTSVELILIVAAGRALWYRLATSRWRVPTYLAALVLVFAPLAWDYFVAIHFAHATGRGRLVQMLASSGGRHLVFVSYTEAWNPDYEWVYNGADLDGGSVVFAHLRPDGENRRLIDHFPDRTT